LEKILRKNLVAQGTVEYLVILAVVVVISLVVVGLFTNMFSSSSQQVINSSSKIGTSSGGGISIVEAVLDSAGDSLIKLSNTSSDPITLTRISVGGIDNNYSEQVVGMDSKTFSLSDLTSGCTCASGQKSVSCEYIITYTQNGIVKTSRINKTIECVTDSVPVNVNVVVQPIVDVVVLEDGTLANPWVINNCLELQDMNQHLDGNYILGNDINCYDDTRAGGALYNGGLGFKPIAFYNRGWCSTYFTGSLDGKNYSINGLYAGDRGHLGLFTCSSGNISNVHMSNVDFIFSSLGRSGGLVGENSGVISNCSSTGTLTSNQDGDYVGGLVGSNTGSISNSFSTVAIDGYGGAYHGGLAGYSSGPISNSYSTGSITDCHNYSGGLVGFSDGTISDSYSTSNVDAEYNGTPPDYIGGLAGYSSGPISNCYATGIVDGANTTNLGGLVGYSSGSIINSYSTSQLRGGWDNSGGLVGYSTGSISNSYSNPSSLSLWGFVGGLVGRNDGNISNCYSSGVMNAAANIGGLVGHQYSGNISNSYSTTNVSCSELSGCTSSTIGGLIGTKSGGNLSNVWWYNSKTNCCGNGTCTSCTKASAASDFFVVTQNVYDSTVPYWTFGVDANWVSVDNNYPILSWQ